MYGTIALSLPKPYAPLECATRGRYAIIHAKLNARALETLLAHAYQGFSLGSNIVLFGPDLSRAKVVLQRFASASGIKLRMNQGRGQNCKTTVYTKSNGARGELWLAQGNKFVQSDIPTAALDRVYAVQCEQIESDIAEEFNPPSLFLSGLFALSGHWFYEYATDESTNSILLTAENICEHWPKEREHLLPRTDPYHRRWMLLEDVPPSFGSSSFLAFARKRLKVTTDKPLEFLTTKQREEAKGQWGTPIVSLELHKFQRSYIARKRLGKKQSLTKRDWHLVIKFRRGGVTVNEQGESYQMCVERPYSNVATFAHTSSSTKRIFRIAKLMSEKDPRAVPLVNDSKTELEFANGSLFFIGTAGGKSAFRGDTLQRAHWSEVSKSCIGPNQISDQEEIIAGLVGAASNGQIVAESTPNGKEWMFQEAEKWKIGQSEWNLIFFRWFDDPRNRAQKGTFNEQEILETLSAEETLLVQKHGLTVEQIAFRRQKQREYGVLFPQEMPESLETCFISSGTPYFDLEIIKDLIDTTIAVPKRSIPGGYEIRWEEPIKGRQYVAGCDTSEGLAGCDSNGIGILDKETGAQVAAIHGLFSPPVLAEQAVRLCKDYNRAMLGIERENHGHAVLQKVVELGYRKPHFRGGPLYYFKPNQSDIRKSRPGWSTNGESRPILLADLRDAVHEGHMKVRDLDFLGETLSFRLQSSGKWEHDVGAHDDTIIKWGIAWQMRKHHRSKPSITVVGG